MDQDQWKKWVCGGQATRGGAYIEAEIKALRFHSQQTSTIVGATTTTLFDATLATVIGRRYSRKSMRPCAVGGLREIGDLNVLLA